MIIETQPCCYGFFNHTTLQIVDGFWEAAVQRPFRGHWLWLWGAPDAILTSLRIDDGNPAVAEQLVLERGAGLPFAAMVSGMQLTPDQFVAYAGITSARDRLEGAVVHHRIAKGFGMPHLIFPTARVGSKLSFKFQGGVLGVVLVGEQIP